MSKQSLRLLGAVMALAGSLLLAYAAYSYTAQRRLEATLEAQIPGQNNNPAITNTPVILLPANNPVMTTAGIPSPDATHISPSVTPLPVHVTPVQPDATTAAQLLLTPTAIFLAPQTRVPTDTTDYTNSLSRPPVTPTPTRILAGVAVPTPESGAPTLIAAASQAAGVPRGAGSPATELIIPKLNMNVPVKPAEYVTYQSGGQVISDWNIPYDAAGHLVTTAQPGEIGNAVLSGHHNLIGPNTFGLGLFAGLWNLVQGDEIEVLTQEGKTQLWRVTDSFPVKEGGEPLSVRIEHAQEIMADTPQPTLTLITCWNGQQNPLSGNMYRWVVHAELVGIN
jgi:hypothetical protein